MWNTDNNMTRRSMRRRPESSTEIFISRAEIALGSINANANIHTCKDEARNTEQKERTSQVDFQVPSIRPS